MDLIKGKIERFDDFFAMRSKAKLLGFFVGSEFPLKRYNAAKSLPSGRALRPSDFNVDGFMEDYENLYAGHEECGGDFVFGASAFWGIPWLEALIGCEIFADFATGSIYAKPAANPVFSFNRNNEWAALCKEFLTRLSALSAGRFPLATTRVRGVSDVLALLHGNDGVIFEMMDNSGLILNQAGQIAELIVEFSKFQLEFIPDFYGRTGSFYYHAICPKGTVWLQEDSAALLSPELFNRFIYDADMYILSRLGSCILHQHPVTYVPGEFIDMPFTALELHRDEGGKSIKQLSGFHKKITAKKPLIVWGKLTEEELDFLMDSELENVAVICCVDSAKEAQKILERHKGRRAAYE